MVKLYEILSKKEASQSKSMKSNEAVAILMRSNKIEDIMSNFFSHIMGRLTVLSQSIDDIKNQL
ncbi:unnamed protein product [marine sediment metagenome]|uniref:Uncharacterized protein n=1 Tax=marine sediment metagenome TaxID=412755 RepID=X0VIV5_9ZZZZ